MNGDTAIETLGSGRSASVARVVVVLAGGSSDELAAAGYFEFFGDGLIGLLLGHNITKNGDTSL